MSGRVRRKKRNKKNGKTQNGSKNRENSRKGWKPPTGKELKKLQEDWDHVT